MMPCFKSSNWEVNRAKNIFNEKIFPLHTPALTKVWRNFLPGNKNSLEEQKHVYFK